MSRHDLIITIIGAIIGLIVGTVILVCMLAWYDSHPAKSVIMKPGKFESTVTPEPIIVPIATPEVVSAAVTNSPSSSQTVAVTGTENPGQGEPPSPTIVPVVAPSPTPTPILRETGGVVKQNIVIVQAGH